MAREDYLAYNPDLTGIAVAYQERVDEASLKVAPHVKKAWSGKYPSYAAADTARPTDVKPRAVGGDIDQSRPPGLTWNEYVIGEYPLEDLIDRQEMRRGVVGVEQKLGKTKRLTQELNLQFNDAVVTAATASGIPTHTVTTKWDQAGSDPFEEIMEYAKTLQENCGAPCTHVLIPWPVVPFMALKVQKEYRLLAKVDPKGAIKAMLADFEVVFSKGSKYNATGAKYESQWADDVLLWYSPAGESKKLDDFMPAFAATIIPDDLPETVVFNYPDPKKKGEWVQVVKLFVVKRLCVNAGYLINDCLT
jgi:hypothetical protein